MAYQSLYRKYRPQTFADVVGQGHVVRTLQNALVSNRVAHGYLFTGTRGTAKTTVARLLAKALNCESAPHAVAEPCNNCDACRSITGGSAVDVIELDAASHRGVSDIEEVRRAVGFGPMQLRYKVFIIDEAHQLSSDAKDAFLKTLEEPPANVVFILATTEPQAIPITIRSRCQQFDFKRGSMNEITGRLRYVLECEGVSYTPDAVSLVARGAEGSYRDSLSLLEQVLAFSPAQITAADVESVLGSLDAEMLSKVVVAVSERNAPETFALAGQILDAGKEARTLLRTLSLHFRDLLLVSVGGPAVSAEMTPDEVRRLQTEAKLFTPQQMMQAMDVLNEAQGETRWNNQHRLLTELTFLKLMNLGAGQGEGLAFAVAPIVFSEAILAATPVSGATVVSVSSGSSPLSPSPFPPADGEKGEPEENASGATNSVSLSGSPFSPSAGGKGLGDRGEEPEETAAYFAAEPVDTDEADDMDDENDFAPLGDADAPDDDFGASPLSANPNAPTPLPEPVTLTDEPASVAAESEEWKLFADDPQPGPGLFDESAPELAAVQSVPPDPPPPPISEGEAGVPSETPALPMSRERNPRPPALSLQNGEEPSPSPLPKPVAAEVSSTFDEDEGAASHTNEPPVTLGQVKSTWGNFMRQTERFSRMTFMYLQQAEPVQVAGGRTVVLMIHHRPYYEMLTDKPKAQAFIKKLLARVLGREVIGLRLELDPAQVLPARRLRVAEAADKSRRYDRIKALDDLDVPGAMAVVPSYPASPTPVPERGASFGWSGRQDAQPSSALTGVSLVAAHAPEIESRPLANVFSRPAIQDTYSVAAPSPPTGDRRQIALAEPLVQEILQHFGGDIMLE